MLKKFTAVLLGTMLLFTGSITEASRPTDDIEYAIDMNVFDSMTSKELQQPLTRGEYALWLVNIMELVDDGHTTHNFTDVDYTTDEGLAIKIATQNGAINGYSPTIFKPNAPLQRGQMINLLQRFYKFEKTGVMPHFADIDEDEMKVSSVILRNKGIALGYPNNVFKPYQTLTKREGLAFLVRSDRQYRIEVADKEKEPELPTVPTEPKPVYPNEIPKDLDSKYDGVFVLWDENLPTKFANCTELRTVYKYGVPYNHPAYLDKFDRNNDGWACETF